MWMLRTNIIVNNSVCENYKTLHLKCFEAILKFILKLHYQIGKPFKIGY